MDTRLTQAELDALPQKTKKNPDVVKMYLEHDFLTAYAKHTDFRVVVNGYKGAIGANKDWERHGQLQLEFLKSQGMQPSHTLLDIGCGTGRLARKAVPYLDAGCYTGFDISEGAVKAAWELSAQEGWINKGPFFSFALVGVTPVDYAWAFSVFIHLPDDECGSLMQRVASWLAPGGKFFFSYVPEKVEARTGLKQFRHTLECYQRMCGNAGLSFEDVPWGAEQRIALARHL